MIILNPSKFKFIFSEMQAAVLRYTKWSENTMDTCWRINSGHSMIAYFFRQPTKSNILWFVLDLWPLKILAPTWIQFYFFRNASSINPSKFKFKPHPNYWYFCIERWDLLLLRFSENAVLFHIECVCRKTAGKVNRPPYRYTAATRWACPPSSGVQHRNFLGELKHPCRHDAQNDSKVRKITHTFSIKKIISQQPFIRFFPS